MRTFDSHLIAYWVEGEFPACIRITGMGTLCGYIGVPPSHPWYGKSYNDVEAECHGGLTYSGHETWGHPAYISYLESRQSALMEDKVPAGFPSMKPLVSMYERKLEEEEKEKAGTSKGFPYETGLDVWWIGFDCAHSGDAIPGIESSNEWGVYRDESYVHNEISGLVQQATQIAQCDYEKRV